MDVSKRFRYASFILMGLSLLLLLFRWEMFPKFVDIYYHFSVAQGFTLAKGVVLHDFWEFAPLGRPHLYPPFFHLLIIPFLKLGIPTDFLLRIFSFIQFPLLQIISWFILRKLYNERVAFYSILLLTSSYSFYWFETNMLPASLALTFSLIMYYFIEKNKWITPAILLALSLYTHTGMGFIIGLSLLFYGFLNRKRLLQIGKSLALSILLFSPWLFHMLANLTSLSPGNQANFISWKLHILLLFLAVGGLFVCIRLKKKAFIPLAYALAMITFLFFYPSIYFSGHNLFSWALLGGIFLGHYDRLLIKKYLPLFILFLLVVLLITPVLVIPKNDDETLHVSLEKGTLARLFFYQPEFEDLNLLQERNRALADYLQDTLAEQEIFYTKNAYLGGLLTTLTRRAQAGGMYSEVKPFSYRQEAHLWIQDQGEAMPSQEYVLQGTISGYKIYRKDGVQGIRTLPSFTIPLFYAFLALLFLVSIIFYDLRKGND